MPSDMGENTLIDYVSLLNMFGRQTKLAEFEIPKDFILKFQFIKGSNFDCLLFNSNGQQSSPNTIIKCS